jgi:hypothetical protein
MRLFGRTPKPEPTPAGERPPRLLFLDDDLERASVFLAEHPEAVWVQTAAECIAKLEEAWDHVHLDHDLGGEHFVDLERDDCGMEVVRWICLLPRPHLRPTRFTIHSHNLSAATVMGMQMMLNGFTVEIRPFGEPPLLASAEPGEMPPISRSPLAALAHWVRRLLGRDGVEPVDDYGYIAERPGPDEPPPVRPNFDWSPPSVVENETNPRA